MPKPTAEELRDRARTAAVEAAPHAAVGDFIGFIEETEDVITMQFASRQKGYAGWQWQVSLFVSDDEVTVSEVNLMPGENSLLAPDWVPWAERLADYKALQAELEAQAAEEAEESEDVEDSEDSEEVVEDVVEEVEVTNEESAVALEEDGDQAETDSDDAGKRPPRFLRRRLGRLKKKK
jgi:NACalpha-BTF3-like transcription factor